MEKFNFFVMIYCMILHLSSKNIPAFFEWQEYLVACFRGTFLA